MTRVSSLHLVPLIIIMVVVAPSVVFTTQSDYDQSQPSGNFGTPEATASTSAGPKFE